MPTTSTYTGVPIEKLLHNATYLWGIFLHPSGETSILDFILEPADNVVAVQKRSFGFLLQVACFILAGCVFIHNFNISRKLVALQSSSLSGWCCLISSIIGIIISALFGLAIYEPKLNCRVLIWTFGITRSIANVCHSIIMHHRAYLALCQQRWVLIGGIILNFFHIGNMLVSIIYSFVTIDASFGCIIYYNQILPYLTALSNAPFNGFCFGIFTYITYIQYKKHGLNSWRYLARNGIQTMLLILICNFSCDIIILLELIGIYSEIFFVIDWIIVLTILSYHCLDMINMNKVTGTINQVLKENAPPTITSLQRPTLSVSRLTYDFYSRV
ncbi:hypothetical protein BDF19DRAFT_248264 [Syncephalis fuscata]|nr:hypothetical protein BDF19DRAFT_248264 [Syncephalis fuscata]